MKKPFSACTHAITQFIKDVPAGTVRIYNVSDLPEGMPDVFPASLRAKWAQVSVAVSGSAESNQAWMAICPYRVDTSSRCGSHRHLVYDIDPAMVVFNTESMHHSVSGLVAYHQDFLGRTTTASAECDIRELPQTVEQIQQSVVSQLKPLDEAHQPVLESLHHMARALAKFPDWPPPPNVE
jgi:hypothetical protein